MYVGLGRLWSSSMRVRFERGRWVSNGQNGWMEMEEEWRHCRAIDNSGKEVDKDIVWTRGLLRTKDILASPSY